MVNYDTGQNYAAEKVTGAVARKMFTKINQVETRNEITITEELLAKLLPAAQEVMLHASWTIHKKSCKIWEWDGNCDCGVYAARDNMRALLAEIAKSNDT